MAKQVLNNGEDGSIIRSKINSNFTEVYDAIGGFSGVTDGDKTDIVVSGGGLTWTIDTDVVTYSKMQNVSAASRLLGRGSENGSGDPQEITLGSGLAMTGTVLSSTGSGLPLTGGTLTGQLTVGTTSAWNSGVFGPLRLQSTDYPSMRLYSTTQDKTCGMYLSPGAGLQFFVNGSGDTFGTVRLSINSAGVGFGATDVPSYAIDVKQVSTAPFNGVRVSNAANDSMMQFYSDGSAFRIRSTFASSGSYFPMILSSGGVDSLRCAADGNVEILTGLTINPAVSATPASNGNLVVERTSNTSLTFKLRGSDGVVRSGSITLS